MSKSFEQSVGDRKPEYERTELAIEQWVDSLKRQWPDPEPRANSVEPGESSSMPLRVEESTVGSREFIPKRSVRRSPFQSSVFSQSSNDIPGIEAYRSLRTRLLRAQALKGIRSVLVTSSVPGEGKTFTANNIAVCHSHLQNTRVLLVDSDLRTAGLSVLLGEQESAGIGDAMEGRCEFEEVVMATPADNFCFVPAGRSKVPAAELFAGNRWKEFLEWAAEHFTLTIVDTPPVTLVADTELLISGCDAVLVIVKTRFAPREMVERAAERVEKSKLLGVVLNCVERTGRASYAGYYGNSDRAGESGKKKR